MKFFRHDQFDSELKKLAKKYESMEIGLDAVERLLLKQFDPLNPEEVIAPGKIHRIQQNTIWSLWKVEVTVPGSGLRPSQWPRMWFAVSGDKIVLLCIVGHMQNYDTNTVDKTAIARASDYF
jgi:hypothetical protein